MGAGSKIYEFGEFRLIPAEQLLLRNGVPVPLTPKVFETLVILVENGGRLLTKDELVERVWPDTAASDETLAQNISQLRKALQNGSDGPSLIQTVPKRGYRFVGQVEAVDAAIAEAPAQSSPALPEAAGPVSGPKRAGVYLSAWKRIIFIIAALVLLGLFTMVVEWVKNPPPDPRPPQLTQITFSGKVEPWGGLNTDETRLIFMERNGSAWPLMQTSFEGGGEHPFGAPFSNTKILGLSPKRTEWLIGRFENLSGNMPLWTFPVQGGGPLRVGDVVADSATWFPDGTRILAAKGHEVFSVDRDGHNRRLLFETPGRADYFRWHPDGSRFRFTLSDEQGHASIWEAAADGSNPHRLTLGLPMATQFCCGTWMPNGKDFIFSAVVNQHQGLWVVSETHRIFSIHENKPIQLTNGPTSYYGPLPSSDGKHIFVFGDDYQASPVRYDTRTGTFEPYLSSSESFIDLAFSPDGQWLAYIGEGMILWRSRVDGSERVRLTTPPMRAQRPRWSQDGKRILFVAQLSGAAQTAFIVPAEGGAPIQVYPGDKTYRDFADWSPDGDSIIMDVSAGAAPEEGITLVNLQTRQASQFPGSRGMRNMHWSPDGRFLAATSDDTKTLYLFNPVSQNWMRAGSATSIARMEWSRDSRHLYFQDILDRAEIVVRLDPETLETRRILDFSKLLDSGAVRCGFEGVAPDGSFLGSIRRSAVNVYALDVDLR